MKSVCLAILNYNGRRHLEHLLPTACVAAQNYPGNCAVLVLDNRSSDPDVEWVGNAFPSVEVVVAPKNDFLFSYNWLAEGRNEEIIIFLNNDLKLFPNFIPPLLRHFGSDDVFAVSATSRDWDNTGYTFGPVRLKSHHGIYEWNFERASQTLSHTLFCSGGFMAVDRKKFLELGGFSRLFWPGYAEDLDLGFRAWRKGWRCIFEPASVALHRENGTWGKTGDSRVNRMMWRTALLFQWAALPPAAPWGERAAYVGLTGMRKWLRGQSWWLKTWVGTWIEWQQLRRKFSCLKSSPDELGVILSKIAEPVRLPPQ